MDVTVITQLIGSVGFPIAAFCMMFWLYSTKLEKNTEATNKMSELLNRLLDKLTGD